MSFVSAVLVAVMVIGFFNAKIAGLEGEIMNQSRAWAQGVGITDGSRPDDPITRQEAVTMLHRFNVLYTGENSPVDGEAGVGECLPFTAEEMDILYRIAWAEARGEDDKGLILVINVIMNRKNSPVFSNQNTIRDVVFAPNQFSPITNGAFDAAQPCQRIKDAVHRALRGEDFSRGALFFNAVRLRDTSWAGRNREHLFDHGGHSFYA